MGNLTDSQKFEMWKCHFIKLEIDAFDNQHTVDGKLIPVNFEADNFQSMLRSRMKWVDMLRSSGWKDEEIDKSLIRLYQSRRNAIEPHWLLQAEGSPSAKNRTFENSKIRAALMRDRITKVKNGKSYVKEMPKLPVRHIAKPPAKEGTLIQDV